MPGDKRGGPRPGSGRPRGSLSQKRVELTAKAVAAGITPLEVMLSSMRKLYDLSEFSAACGIAKDAAPYVHPRLSSIEATGKDGKDLLPEERSAVETARALAWLLTSAAHEAGK